LLVPLYHRKLAVVATSPFCADYVADENSDQEDDDAPPDESDCEVKSTESDDLLNIPIPSTIQRQSVFRKIFSSQKLTSLSSDETTDPSTSAPPTTPKPAKPSNTPPTSWNLTVKFIAIQIIIGLSIMCGFIIYSHYINTHESQSYSSLITSTQRIPSELSHAIPSRAADLISTTQRPLQHLLHLLQQIPTTTSLITASLHASGLSAGILINSNFSRKIEMSKKCERLSLTLTELSTHQPEVKSMIYYQTEPMISRFERILDSLGQLSQLDDAEPDSVLGIYGSVKSIFTTNSKDAIRYIEKLKLESSILELMELLLEDANEGIESTSILLTQFNELISTSISLWSDLKSDLLKEESRILIFENKLRDSKDHIEKNSWGWTAPRLRHVEKELRRMSLEMKYLEKVANMLENKFSDVFLGLKVVVLELLVHLKELKKRVRVVDFAVAAQPRFSDWDGKVGTLKGKVDLLKRLIESQN
ncbi:hypothetical protein HK098_005709, partial [Nowakowskiella sp. JEL0407]